MSTLLILYVVIGLLVLVGLVGVLWWAAKRANRRPTPPSAAPLPGAPIAAEPDAWSQAMSEASQARPDAVDQPRTFFSRDALVAPDRELDTSRWDNRPDGSEEYEDGEAPRGGGSIDAGFIQSLRERDKNA